MSNKTLKAGAKKIELAPKAEPKKVFLYILLYVAIFFTSTYLYLVQGNSGLFENSNQANNYQTCIKKDGQEKCTLYVELADNNDKRQKGLADRDRMAKNQGMLFVDGRESLQCFWMKDMRFDLDFVWLNSEKEIVGISEKISKDTYPTYFCQENVQYVLELSSGVANKYGLYVGQKLVF